MSQAFKHKEREIYFDQRVFIESLHELRSSFKFYNPEVKQISYRTIYTFFEEIYEEYMKSIIDLQASMINQIIESLKYANQNFNFDLEMCLRAKIEKVKEQLEFQYLEGQNKAHFFQEVGESNQELPNIIFPFGYERQAFAKTEGNQEIQVRQNEARNRDMEDIHSLEKHKPIYEQVNPVPMNVELRGTILNYGVKDKVVIPAEMVKKQDDSVPLDSVKIGDQVFQLVETFAKIMEIRNYRVNFMHKSNGKYSPHSTSNSSQDTS